MGGLCTRKTSACPKFDSVLNSTPGKNASGIFPFLSCAVYTYHSFKAVVTEMIEKGYNKQFVNIIYTDLNSVEL